MRSFLLAVAFTLCLASCSNDNQKSQSTENTKSALSEDERMAEAKELFEGQCKLCHGIDGTLGLNGAKDLTQSTLSKEERIEVITNGRNAMAAYKNEYSPQEIDMLADYVGTLKK